MITVPFNPETAKPGDIVYLSNLTFPYVFLCMHPIHKNVVLIEDGSCNIIRAGVSELSVEQPEYWFNVYKNFTSSNHNRSLCGPYNSREEIVLN